MNRRQALALSLGTAITSIVPKAEAAAPEKKITVPANSYKMGKMNVAEVSRIINSKFGIKVKRRKLFDTDNVARAAVNRRSFRTVFRREFEIHEDNKFVARMDILETKKDLVIISVERLPSHNEVMYLDKINKKLYSFTDKEILEYARMGLEHSHAFAIKRKIKKQFNKIVTDLIKKKKEFSITFN